MNTTEINPSTKPIGVLLMNLGTPNSPTPEDVRAYLREFLMDPYVVDLPLPLRWALIHGIILRTRPVKSAALYQKIWTDQGSPLLHYTKSLATAVQNQLGEDYVVEWGMRYGTPSIQKAAQALHQKGIQQALVLPLYPQDSASARTSSIEEAKRWLNHYRIEFKVYSTFYDHPEFVDSVAATAATPLKERDWDHLLFSFHGLPQRHIKKAGDRNCLVNSSCCDTITESNRHCYRAQCYSTARLVAEKLGVPTSKYSVGFQSRLGVTPWIPPYTDQLYEALPKQGIKRLAVICPSFVADCLETLEEVQIRGEKQFIAAGGLELFLVPCVNVDPHWSAALGSMIRKCDISQFPC